MEKPNRPLKNKNTTDLVIDALYASYFQKARAFLFPLLRIPRFSHVEPFGYGIYSSWSEEPTQTTRIYVHYKPDLTNAKVKKDWDNLLQYKLISNLYFVEINQLEDNSFLVTFELGLYKQDLTYFRAGKYSKLSKNTKTAVRQFFGVGTAEWAYMESFLEPDAHFGIYANIIGDVTEEELRSVGELCDPPNLEREHFTGKRKVTLIKGAELSV